MCRVLRVVMVRGKVENPGQDENQKDKFSFGLEGKLKFVLLIYIRREG